MDSITNAMARLSFSSDDSVHSDFSTSTYATSIAFTDVFDNVENYAFNDRSPQVRDARVTNALLGLDEDLPIDMDDSIKKLIEKHITNLEYFEIQIQQSHAEFKQQQADRRANQKKLPISRRGRERKEAMQKQI